MEKENNEIRQEVAALVIDECKNFILELRRNWENKRELNEQSNKTEQSNKIIAE